MLAEGTDIRMGQYIYVVSGDTANVFHDIVILRGGKLP